MRALVIGGGIAGPVAAMALQKAGITPTVHEGRPAGSGDLDGWLGLQANGVDALAAIDAAEPVLEVGFPTGTVRFVSGSGRTLGVVPIASPRPGAEVGRTMRRSELYRVLEQEASSRGIDIRHGTRLVDARSSADGVTATFADGTTDTADVLVGADGVRSRVRTLLDPSSAPARYVPALNVGGYADTTPPGARVGELTMTFGRRAFAGHVVAPTGQTWWFAQPPTPEEPTTEALTAISTAEWRTRLHELFRSDRSPVPALVDSTPGELRAWKSYDLASVRVWHDERMVLLGDAAHAVSPSTGQGASMAIEDAVVLARCLRDQPVPDALALFERVRRPRVERVVALGRRTDTTNTPGAVGRVVRDLVLPVVLRRAAARGDRPVAWLHQHHIDWDAPVTADAGT